MNPEIEKRITSWLEGPFDEKSKEEIRTLQKTNPEELEAAFFQTLAFGTGGMRGIMGVGTNRMNIYTVRLATQALANYLKKTKEKGHVFIGYDVRHNSKEFAQEAARVLAGNGIQVYLTKEVCPTPLVSFGCRYFQCGAAIVITASHNPPQYNGYKAYWSDGGQLVPPHDVGVMQEAKSVTEWKLDPLDSPRIQWVGEEIDKAYLKALSNSSFISKRNKDSMRIYYTNLHGTGLRLTPAALKEWGFPPVIQVAPQASLDGSFPFARTPNPEDPSSLKLGMDLLLQEKGDILLATDPDADRVGVAVRYQEGAIRLSGNQVACLLLQYVLSTLKEKNLLPKHAACVKSIVTTEMFRKIAKHFGATCVDVLTGFKYIAEKIHQWEGKNDPQYIFGAEESCGYLFHTFARDKDAISACCLVAELASLAKFENVTLVDLLYRLYHQYGIHREMQQSLSFSETEEGLHQVNSIMESLRKNPPASIAGKRITSITDYLKETPLPKSDVISFQLEDQTQLIVRPSGTEPKLKIYGEAVEAASNPIEKAIAACDLRLMNQIQDLRLQL
ncbi:MAG TPA: phospho-sugar mutase [Chlamydiales bacterium]|nr:phospho-sugar mutase [Chlamydiales bacterium]